MLLKHIEENKVPRKEKNLLFFLVKYLT